MTVEAEDPAATARVVARRNFAPPPAAAAMDAVAAPPAQFAQAALDASLLDAHPGRNLPAPGAAAAARNAMALARQLGAEQDLARAGAWLCMHLLRQGEYAQLQQEALQLLPLLAAQSDVLAEERRETLHALVLAASELGNMEVALDAAHRMARLAQSTADCAASLAAAFTMAVCLERMGDSWQSLRVLRQILQEHRNRPHQGEWLAQPATKRALTQCLNAMCAVTIGLFHRVKDVAPQDELADMLQQARQAAERVLELNPDSTDVRLQVAVLGNQSEVLLYQGELDASDHCWQRAHHLASANGMRAYLWRLQTTRADWLLSKGNAAAARDLTQTLLAQMGEEAPQQTAIRARQSAYRACRDLGAFEAALQHFEVMERLERKRAVTQLRAQSELFVTRSEAQQAQTQAESQAERARLDALRERRRADEQTLQAELDALTQLGNRRHVQRRWAEWMAKPAGAEPSLSVALVDVDHFKRVNDRFGHAIGDQVLVELANLLRHCTRSVDVVARLGGEEFLVLWWQMGSTEASEACQRLRAAVQAHDWARVLGASAGPAAAVTVSVGLASAPPLELALLMQRADQAMYRAKAGGRNRVCVAAAETRLQSH